MSGVSNRREFLAASAVLLGGIGLGGLAAGCARATRVRRLPIPRLLDAREARNAVSLTAQAGRTSFFGGAATATRGFNGSFLGPTIRVYRGEAVRAGVTNRLAESTTVHWHGLLIPSEADGGPHHLIAPGATWRPELAVDQPAATLWYHAHPHPRTASQVYSGLAGMLIVEDAGATDLGLPARYGVDDIPLILRDASFEGDQLVYPVHPMTQLHGARGAVILANGVPDPTLEVPRGLVRVRIVNAANARVFDLSMSDGGAMFWVGTDGGLLERPIRLGALHLAPGQRAEILLDFTSGRRAALVTGRDPVLRMGGMGPMGGRRGMGMMGGMADPLAATTRVLSFEPTGPRRQAAIPERLATPFQPDRSLATRHRRLTLTMGMAMGGMGRGGGMMGSGMGRGGRGMAPGTGPMGAMFGIGGAPFDMHRVDQDVRLGDAEIWEVSGQMMPHPFHMHGVHFHVLSRGGGAPGVIDQGPKDTVLVEEPVELLVRFTRQASSIPFMYHCHTLEHEDGGMMGQYRAA